MILTLTLAAMLFSPQDMRPSPDEPFCITRAYIQGAAAKVTLDQALAGCRARFQWNDAETQLARELARADLDAIAAYFAAEKAGVDPAVMDQASQSFTITETLRFGWPGEPVPEPAELIDRLNAFFAARLKDPEQRRLADIATRQEFTVINMAFAFNQRRELRLGADVIANRPAVIR